MSLDVTISRSSFANLRPKHVLYKRTLAHRICVCITLKNVQLLLNSLVKEIEGLSHSLNDYVKQMVCGENDERCMSNVS